MAVPVEIASLPEDATLSTGQQTVGASKVALKIPLNDRVVRGVVIKALSTNNDTVYLGDSDVTANVGFPLAAGESVVFPLNNGVVYSIAGAADQKVAWATI